MKYSSTKLKKRKSAQSIESMIEEKYLNEADQQEDDEIKESDEMIIRRLSRKKTTRKI